VLAGLRAEPIEQVRVLLQRPQKDLADDTLHQGQGQAVDGKG
jgi:hypothetical protein